MADGLGLDPWWNEPAYKTCNTFHLRGLFILRKLREHDSTKFHDVMRTSIGMTSPTHRTLARLNGRPSSPSWVRARRRSRTCRSGWGGCGGDIWG